MNFDEFLKNLKNPEKTRNFNVFKNYTLEKFESCLKIMGLERNAHSRNFSTRISVVGTNGKGSVSSILSQLAQKSGLYKRIGLYTSPHLLQKEERINLNGKNISSEKLDSLFDELIYKYKQLLTDLSYFELFTIIAFYFFKIENCDLEIYEAGLGGRLDATRLAYSEILVVTKIGIDHSEILGNGKESILKEKLAISSVHTKFLFYYDQEDFLLNQIISDFCKEKHIQAYYFSEKFQETDYLSYNRRFCEFILYSLHPDYDFTKLKVLKLNIPGRMEVLQENPLILFDVAHNVSALDFLLRSIKNKMKIPEMNVIFSCLKDKDASGMLEILSKELFIDNIYFISSLENPMNYPLEAKIQSIQPKQLRNLLSNPEKPFLVTGSFRLYSQIQEILHR